MRRDLVEQRRASVPEITYPAELPIAERRQEILDTIRDHQVVVIAGETGSGKSTQIPKFCLELGRGVDAMIGHTQPRRLAARSIASRVADELGGAAAFADRLREQGIAMIALDPDRIRAVTHLDVDRDGIEQAIDIVRAMT